MKPLIILTMLLCSWTVTGVKAMTQDELEKYVIASVDLVEHKKGYVVFNYNKVQMALISDVKHNRMRIISPIAEYPELTLEQINKIMESNFHKALDARYASSGDVLYSAFIHPLSPLTETQLKDALDQVAALALTFGTTYSSGVLSYGDNE